MKNNKVKLYMRLLILIICFILILLVIRFVFAQYKSSATIDPSIQTALYVFKEDYQEFNVSLSDIYPRKEPFTYMFSIANTDGENITETYIDYDLEITTTTNLPLKYELYLNEKYNTTNATNILKTVDVSKDEYGTYFQKFVLDTKSFGFEKAETNVYQLVVYFPEQYNDVNYQNIIEGITINVNSKQKI